MCVLYFCLADQIFCSITKTFSILKYSYIRNFFWLIWLNDIMKINDTTSSSGYDVLLSL